MNKIISTLVLGATLAAAAAPAAAQMVVAQPGEKSVTVVLDNTGLCSSSRIDAAKARDAERTFRRQVDSFRRQGYKVRTVELRSGADIGKLNFPVLMVPVSRGLC